MSADAETAANMHRRMDIDEEASTNP